MPNSTIISLKLTENIELPAYDIKTLSPVVVPIVIDLINGDDPQLADYYEGDFERSFKKNYHLQGDPEVKAYTIITVTKEFDTEYTQQNYMDHESESIQKVVDQFDSGIMKLEALRIIENNNIKEVHLFFARNAEAS